MSFAAALQLPHPSDLDRRATSWERDQVVEHLGAHFQIVREIGRGGMGVVFLARDVALHRLVAIKVLRAEFASSSEHRARFRSEARLTARLSHPNIVPVHAFGEAEDLVYIVMKYVHGESLAERLRRDGHVPADEARRVVRDLALALDAAHGDGVVHRDLKPENVLLERGTNRAMITDFGVALLRSLDPVHADAQRAFGTPHYMSPEQATGALDVDGRSDLYSLGVLGYYMLSGELPFDGTTFEALAARHVAEAHVPLAALVPSVPEDLRAVVEQCLAKERDDRPRTARDVVELLGDAPGGTRGASGRSPRRAALLGVRTAAHLAVFATAMRAAFNWTMI
jgi:serine/threonine-protein kinase